jgi:hypothetical protein
MKITELKNKWAGGQAAAVFGSGQSISNLYGEELKSICENMVTIGINGAMCLDIDMMYYIGVDTDLFMDGGKYYECYPAWKQRLIDCYEERALCSNARFVFREFPDIGTEKENHYFFNDEIPSCGSLPAALGLALYMGCYPVYLYGVDRKGGHFYNPDLIVNGSEYAKREDKALRELKEEGIIYNCNPESELKIFEFLETEKAVG